MRLTLRTLLAYLDDTLEPARAREIGQKLANTPEIQDLVERIRRVARSRSVAAPSSGSDGSPADPNVVAGYLSDALSADHTAQFEAACLESDVHLADVATCHQILTLVLCEQIRIPPTARRRMYQLVKGRESVPSREPGNVIPVGGVVEDHTTTDDDTDAAYLLGLPAFSRSESWGRLGSRAAVVGVLLLGLAFTVWMAWPPAQPSAEPAPAFAVVAVPTPTTPTTRANDTPAARPSDTANRVSPGGLVAAAAAGPMPPPSEKEPVPVVPVPSAEQAVLGRAERLVANILVRRPAEGAAWERVTAAEPAVRGGVRLVSLPGYKTDVRLDGGVDLHLWGSLPDLVFAPLLDAAVTPTVPHPGTDADLTVHRGRVYVTARPGGGRTVRVRVGGEAWDVRLADDQTEVVVEVTHTLSPGPVPEPPITHAALAVLRGRATVTSPAAPDAEPVPVARDGQVIWDSVTRAVDVRTNTDAHEWATLSGYLARLQVYADARRAEVILGALGAFANRLTDPVRVRATFDEALQGEEGPPSPQDEAAVRVALFTFAALGDVTGVAGSIADPRHPVYRVSAIEAARFMLAAEPGLTDPFRQVLVEKLRLDPAQADEALRLLRGVSEVERQQFWAETLDRLVADLSSDALPVREMAFQVLASFVDPQDPGARNLPYFDAAGPEGPRASAAAAWKKKADELKAKPATPPAAGPAEPAPPPRQAGP